MDVERSGVEPLGLVERGEGVLAPAGSGQGAAPARMGIGAARIEPNRLVERGGGLADAAGPEQRRAAPHMRIRVAGIQERRPAKRGERLAVAAEAPQRGSPPLVGAGIVRIGVDRGPAGARRIRVPAQRHEGRSPAGVRGRACRMQARGLVVRGKGRSGGIVVACLAAPGGLPRRGALPSAYRAPVDLPQQGAATAEQPVQFRVPLRISRRCRIGGGCRARRAGRHPFSLHVPVRA